jgi:dihydrofolate reductase
VAGEVAALKERAGGNLLKYGTGELDRTLFDHQLVDELHLWVYPVVAGRGARLLDGFPTVHFELLDATTFDSGIVIHVLRPKKEMG